MLQFSKISISKKFADKLCKSVASGAGRQSKPSLNYIPPAAGGKHLTTALYFCKNCWEGKRKAD
jgi:hypothetical protein